MNEEIKSKSKVPKWVLIVGGVILLALVIFSITLIPKPAKFEVQELKIVPEKVALYEEAKIEASIKNVGEKEGSHIAILKVAGEKVAEKEVKIMPKEIKTVSFTLMKDEEGTYEIEINGKKDDLIVDEGLLTPLYVGDKWVHDLSIEGITYTTTSEVVDEEIVDGKESYVMKIDFGPKLHGMVRVATVKVDKKTLLQLIIETAETFVTLQGKFTYNFPEGPPFPLEVGKKYTIIETEKRTAVIFGEAETITTTTTSKYVIEGIEEIEVPAGKFKCFKIVEYDETGKLIETVWVSAKVKYVAEVKTIDHKTGGGMVLKSYTIGE